MNYPIIGRVSMEADKIDDSCWRDITEEFRISVSQLQLGELLKTDQFTLLEAMSALELMDPKMDGGMIFKKVNRQILTLDQSIKAGTIKVSNLELDELIGIIDDTFACLVTWLDGHSLAQTVMTNMYLHDTELIDDRCLRVFSQAILKIVDHLDRLVQTVFCIEDEDFQLNNNRFNLASQVNEQKIINSLEDLCLFYERYPSSYHHPNTNHSSTNHTNHQQPEVGSKKAQPTTKIPLDELEIKRMSAIANRLRFTQNLYMCLQNVTKHLLKDYAVSGPNSATLIQKTVKQFQSYVNICDQRLEKCLSFLSKWSETIDLGVKPIARSDGDEATLTKGDYPTIMGFDPLVANKLSPPAYPRSPSIKTRPVTIYYLRDLITKLRECIKLSNCFYHKSFNKSLEAMEQFSKKSCVISRSFNQALYLPNRLTNCSLLKDELYQSMSVYCEPVIQILKKDVNKSSAMNEFLEESLQTFSQVVTLYGHNQARQHEKFPDLILAFKNLQYSAFLVNDVLKNNLVYSWTTYYFAKYCIKYVLSGLELELFSPHEYPYVFWYLYDILYQNEKSQLEYAKQLIYESQYVLDQEQVSNQTCKQGGKAKGNAIKKNRKRTLVNTSFHDRNLLLNEALRFLSGGLFLLTYGLKLQGKIRSPSFEYTSEEICFDHRFGSITGSSVFQAYKSTLSRLEKLDSIYREASECFSEARLLFEKCGEGQDDCLKVCKTNMVVAKILSSNTNSFAEREVEFCFDRHPDFPTVKL